MSIADFMTACLYDPAHGYYRVREPLGRAGDFITAPEVSQIFGELIGLWAVEMWHAMGAPKAFQLIELGPGRGTLMADALRACRLEPEFGQALTLHLIETNGPLRAAQKENLSLFDVAIEWHEVLGTVPGGPAIVIANEFFDALPIRQFLRQGDVWYERCVGLDEEGGLVFCFSPSPILDDGGPGFGVLQSGALEGDIFEIRPGAEEIVRTLGVRGAAHSLCALIIDYGHVRSACGDTLQAVRAHAHTDPLEAPGKADLTAHVDFAALAATASSGGLDVWGPLSQRALLLSLGLAQRCESLADTAEADQAQRLLSGAHRLVDPDQMGDLFKAVALTSQDLAAPPAFEVHWDDKRLSGR